ncbi:hypothetical protein Hanom_Chr09g00837081 [Helianthus anomalus]
MEKNKNNHPPTATKRQEWEIDPSKLIVKSALARGTYGTVHRGVYDGVDVAGQSLSTFSFLLLFFYYFLRIYVLINLIFWWFDFEFLCTKRFFFERPTNSIPGTLGAPTGQTEYSESNPSPPPIPGKTQ